MNTTNMFMRPLYENMMKDKMGRQYEVDDTVKKKQSHGTDHWPTPS